MRKRFSGRAGSPLHAEHDTTQNGGAPIRLLSGQASVAPYHGSFISLLERCSATLPVSADLRRNISCSHGPAGRQSFDNRDFVRQAARWSCGFTLARRSRSDRPTNSSTIQRFDVSLARRSLGVGGNDLIIAFAPAFLSLYRYAITG